MIDICTKGSDGTTHIFCYEIFLTNGKTLFITNNTQPILANDVVYEVYPRITINKATFNDIGENLIELKGLYAPYGIDYSLTDAKVHILIAIKNQGAGTSGIELYDTKLLFTYYCVRVRSNVSEFTMCLEPFTSQFDRTINPTYSSECRARLGDCKCSIDLSKFTTEYQIANIAINIITLSSCDKPDGYYDYGLARIFNDGLILEAKIKYHYRTVIHLDKSVPESIIADKILLTRGCDKTIKTCCNVFNNVINFRGEPFIPVQ